MALKRGYRCRTKGSRERRVCIPPETEEDSGVREAADHRAERLQGRQGTDGGDDRSGRQEDWEERVQRLRQAEDDQNPQQEAEREDGRGGRLQGHLGQGDIQVPEGEGQGLREGAAEEGRAEDSEVQIRTVRAGDDIREIPRSG